MGLITVGHEAGQQNTAKRASRIVLFLNFVVTSRNYGYGGDPLERFQVFLGGFSELCKMCDFSVQSLYNQ
jgi:hypothetical protein